MSVQNNVLKLQEFWADKGCGLIAAHPLEAASALMAPVVFFPALGPKPWKAAFWQPLIRPEEARGGDHPLRLCRQHQFLVMIKPAPEEGQLSFIESLQYLGADVLIHDIRFHEESLRLPALDIHGTGWRVTANGLDIARFTYLQRVGGLTLTATPLVIVYDIERLTVFVNDKKSVQHLDWGNWPPFAALQLRLEEQFSRYFLEAADITLLQQMAPVCLKEAERLLQCDLYLPAYDWLLRAAAAVRVLEEHRAPTYKGRIIQPSALRRLAAEMAQKHLALEADPAHG